MNVNGVTGGVNTYATQRKTNEKEVKEKDQKEVTETGALSDSAISEEAVVYEPSANTEKVSASKKPDKALIDKLKADSEAHVAQLQDIVSKLISKQGVAYDASKGLKSFFEGLTVDAETQAKAKEDISENGYYGVEQTSSRIFDFAMALSGGDEEQMEKMKDAFLKGYDQATKAWGDKLPDICQQTYDAVLKKFDDYKNQNSSGTENVQ